MNKNFFYTTLLTVVIFSGFLVQNVYAFPAENFTLVTDVWKEQLGEIGALQKTTYLPAPFKLMKGSSGNEATELQVLLYLVGFYRGNLDGKLGKMSESAIMSFQRIHGLTADGIAGKKTQQKLVDVAFSSGDSLSKLSDQDLYKLFSKAADLVLVKRAQSLPQNSSTANFVDSVKNTSYSSSEDAMYRTYMGYVNDYLSEIGEEAANDPDYEMSLEFNLGDSNSMVSLVKYELLNIGYPVGEINKNFDPILKSSVKRFQSDFGLVQTGALDQKTREQITDEFIKKVFDFSK